MIRGSLALIPYSVLIVAYGRRTSRLSHVGLAIILSVLPTYMIKVICDERLGKRDSWTWPVRVIENFDDSAQRHHKWAKFETEVRKGKPFQLGQDWYRVGDSELWDIVTKDNTPNGPIIGFRVKIATSRVGLEPPPDKVQFALLAINLNSIDSIERQTDAFYLSVPLDNVVLILDRQFTAMDPVRDVIVKEKMIEVVKGMRIPTPQVCPNICPK